MAIGSFLVSLSFQARKHLKEQNELPDLKDPAMKDAAVRIQSVYRGFQVRKKKTDDMPDLKSADVAMAAVRIQKAYRGFSTVNVENNSFQMYDLNLIKQDLINHFNIRQGEKLADPTFGCIIWDALFEPLTDVLKDAIVKNVTRIINTDPRTSATEVQVTEFEQGLQIECTLTYLTYNISEQLRLQFDKDTGIL